MRIIDADRALFIIDCCETYHGVIAVDTVKDILNDLKVDIVNDKPKVNPELRADLLKRLYEAKCKEVEKLKAERKDYEYYRNQCKSYERTIVALTKGIAEDAERKPIMTEEVREAIMRLSMCARRECLICKYKGDPREECSDRATKCMNTIADAFIERKRGEWLLDGRCSECFEHSLSSHKNYRPNCGADNRPKLAGKHADQIIIDEAVADMRGADDE